MTGDPYLYMLQATDRDGGWKIVTGPLSLTEAVAAAETFLTPHGWHAQFLQVTPWDRAVGHFTGGGKARPQPVEAADWFVDLRRKIYTHPSHDGVEDPCAQAVVAHLEAHRPLTLWAGDEECLLGECDHDTTDGRCPVEPAEPLCVACSVICDSHSEYGPKIPDGCRVTWPCTPLTTAAAFYRLLRPPGGRLKAASCPVNDDPPTGAHP